MTIAANAIITRIREVLDSGRGSTRIIATTILSEGHLPWVGQSISKPRFDIEIGKLERHNGSPMSAKATHRLDELSIKVELHHKLKSVVQVTARATARYQALSHADLCLQALGYPNNLLATNAGTSTNIISGMLVELDRDIVKEDWTGPEKELVTQITGKAIVKITQA